MIFGNKMNTVMPRKVWMDSSRVIGIFPFWTVDGQVDLQKGNNKFIKIYMQ